MNFGKIDLDDDVVAFWADVRQFFDEHVTEETHEEERRTGGGFNEALHLEMGARRWVAPEWPVEEGGAALDPLRARILRHELYRSGAPFILSSTTLLPPVAIRMFGDPRLQSEVLPGVADGTIRICLGYTEPDCGSDLAAVKTRAVRDGDEWVINGQKMFTTGAQFCQYCFCLTRTNTAAAKHKGLTVFLIPLDLPNVEIRPIETLGGERTNFVHFDDVRVADRFRLGEVDAGWSVVSAPLAQEHGMGSDEDSGGSTYVMAGLRLLDEVSSLARSAVEAAAEPDAASGSCPRLDDPVVRERLARVRLDLEAAKIAPGALGRVAGADALMRAASDLLDLLGPLGLLRHDAEGAIAAGLAEATFRFAPGTGIYGGSTDIHRNLIAERFLGLPRSTPRG